MLIKISPQLRLTSDSLRGFSEQGWRPPQTKTHTAVPAVMFTACRANGDGIHHLVPTNSLTINVNDFGGELIIFFFQTINGVNIIFGKRNMSNCTKHPCRLADYTNRLTQNHRTDCVSYYLRHYH